MNEFFKRGLDKFKKLDVRETLAELTQVLKQNPNHAEAYCKSGIAHSQLGNYQAAVADYTQAIRFNPDYIDAYYNRGNAYSKLADYKAAIADYTQAIWLNPNDAEAYNNRGSAHFQLEDYQAAVTDHTQAISLNPNYTEAHYNLGIVYFRLGEHKKSVANYTRFIQLDPNSAQIYFCRGMVLEELADYQGAVADYTQAIRLNPNYTEAYIKRGNVSYYLENYQEAVADYSQAIQLQPDYLIAYNFRGHAYLKLVDYQGAVADYSQALQLNPYYAEAYAYRGYAQSQEGDYRKAIEDYQQAADLFEQQGKVDDYQNVLSIINQIKLANSQAHVQSLLFGNRKDDRRHNQQQVEDARLLESNYSLYGESKQTAVEKLLQQVRDLYEQGDFDRAIAASTQIIQLNPNNADAYLVRAVVCEALADYQGAVEDYTQAIVLDPDYVTAYHNRSIAYFKLENYQAAVADCDQVLYLTPNSYPAYVERGAAYTRLGEIQAAIADFDLALQLNPSIPQAFFNRAIAQLELENIQEAIADFQQAAQLYSDQGNLAAQQDALKQINRLKKQSSNEFFDQIEAKVTSQTEYSDEVAQIFFDLGNSYFRLGDYQKAIAEYTAVIRLNPDSAEAYFNRGIAYVHLGDCQAAVADFTQAIQLNPDKDDAYYNRGNAYSILANYQAAIIDYTQAIQLNPSNTNAYHYRGIARCKALADYQGAIEDYTQAIELNADYADAYYNRGNAHSQLGNYSEAIEDFQQASELFLQQEKFDNSQNALERIIALIGLEETKDDEIVEKENQPLKNLPKQYLTETTDIQASIDKLALNTILWLDTETSDYNTSKPKISLLQVLVDPEDTSGEGVYILDILNKPEVVAYFVNKIMLNPKIEKVFHNASYDLKFLGNEQAQNITCTYKLAQKITKKVLKTTDLKLKTLAAQLCNFSNIDKEEQGSDWGRRPLTEKQLKYAKMDPVYLAQVHRHLLEIIKTDPVVPMSLSVTNVKVAFECPRLFYLGHHFGGKTMFLPAGNSSGIGTAFHDLSEQFVKLAKRDKRFQALFEPAFEELQPSAIAPGLQKLFYDLAFFPYLQSAIQNDPSKAAALHQLWQGLTGLIGRWAELLVGNRRYCSAKEVIAKTFLAQELDVKHEFTLPNGTQQLVKGRFDSLVYDFEQQRLCVVEYKTYQSVDHSAQLAQVALYSYMLREKIGLSINSAVYSVLPDLQELTFSWEQLENTVHQLVPQKLQKMQQWLTWKPPQPNPPPPTSQLHLCDICPQRQKCKSFFNQKSTENSTGDNSSVTSNFTGEELVATLKSFGIGADYIGSVVGPAFIRVKLKPHAGVKVSSILKLSHDLQVQLGLVNPPLIAPQVGHISFDLPRIDRQIASFEQYIQPQASPQAAVKIAIGVNLEGQLVEADLSDPNTCHFLIAGTTGSGKSEFLRSLLLSLLVRHSPNHLRIALVDPKRVTFPEFEQVAWLYSPVAKDSNCVIELMERLVKEMEKRYQLFEAVSCADLSTYNQQASQLLPRIVCLFDEYADFMANKETRTALEQSIKRLGSMARAAGIHLIIATQRPEAKVVTPLIRSNLPGRVALRTASEADSAIVLGGKHTAAAYLLGKGDLFYDDGAGLHRLQSLLASNIQLP